MREAMTCAEATVRLLERYGVSTVFGIPGVHTLDFCRGLDQGVRHIQARNEQGAGFMAEGWARATGEPVTDARDRLRSPRCARPF